MADHFVRAPPPRAYARVAVRGAQHHGIHEQIELLLLSHDEAHAISQQRIIYVNGSNTAFPDPAALTGCTVCRQRSPREWRANREGHTVRMATDNVITSPRTGAVTSAAAARFASETAAGSLAFEVTMSTTLSACNVQWFGLATNDAGHSADSAAWSEMATNNAFRSALPFIDFPTTEREDGRRRA